MVSKDLNNPQCRICFIFAGIFLAFSLPFRGPFSDRHSLHIPRLPLVFLACMSSSLSTSYLHATYPPSTLALLKVTHIGTNAARGSDLAQEIVYKVCGHLPFTKLLLISANIFLQTFFDEPSIHHEFLLPGPAMLIYLQDFGRRYDGSPSGLINILQLIHLKHFSEQNPLTSLYLDSCLGSSSNKVAAKKLEDDIASFPLLDNLLLRMEPPSLASKLLQQPKSKKQRTVLELLTAVDSARQAFRACTRKLKCGLSVFRVLSVFFVHQERKTAVASVSSERVSGIVKKRRKGSWESIDIIEVAIASMRGRFATREIDMVYEGLMYEVFTSCVELNIYD
jgi:origin recognition complex subunit 3